MGVQFLHNDMKKHQFNMVLIATLFLVIVLSSAWEFVFEDLVGISIHDGHVPETLSTRLEYVFSVAIFAALALILPAIIGHKLIDKHEQLSDEIKRISEEDYLTGLSNRRKIHEIITNEIARSKRYNSTFGIILLDIDNFKTTNDKFGHNTGDRVLVEISGLIRRTIRESDIGGRWGGEEFIVFCPHTSSDGAFALAEKLRSAIEENEFEDAGYKTASFGVTQVEHGDTVESLISRADEALYSAKNSGKNMVLAAK